MRRPSLRATLLTLVVCLLPASAPLRGDETIIQIDGAFVSAHDAGGWTIGNHLIKYSLSRRDNTTGTRAIADALSDRDWLRSDGPDSFVAVNGQRTLIGSAATEFVEASASEHWGGVRLDLKYRVAAAAMNVTRSYAAYPGSSVIETWTSYHVTGRWPVTLSELNSYAFKVESGRVRWITGLSAPDQNGGAFLLNEDEVGDGRALDFGSDRRASEQTVPWFSIRVGEAQFFGAILWAGSWRLRLERRGEAMGVQLGLPAFSTSVKPGATLEGPHAIFGLTNALVPEPSFALRGFIDRGLRHGRPYGSLVTYNTWYAYGTVMDERSLLSEIELAAGIGVEQFVIDAGWWPGINAADPADFVRNWGTYEVDPDRFPSGLGALSRRAHQLGMRFGVWVEPERVARSTVELPGLARERFLAQSDGRYDPAAPNADAHSAQICFADVDARDWVLGKLMAFIDQVQPDYLKWDNNFWVNCNRVGHGHGAGDGNFAHVRGLQMVLDTLRARHPNLEIENCASGGNRLSLDMLGYTDAGWMDDRTFPSGRVRHNVEGLLALFPAPYLLSFGLTSSEEPVEDGPAHDLAFVLRSRMSGMLGMSWRSGEMTEGTRAAVAREIALYKRIRPILHDGAAVMLTPQVPFPGQPAAGWDVIQHVSKQTGEAVILAYSAVNAPATALVHPRGLRQDAIYDVDSADYGSLGSATGVDLMARGIELRAPSISRGHVLVLRVRASRTSRVFLRRQ